MTLKPGTLFWTFLWSIFMGITVGSIGIGAAIPQTNLITQPFVCGNGHMELLTQDYQPTPVEKVTTLTWFCVDNATGSRQEIDIFKMALIAGPFYGLLLFAVIVVWMWARARRGIRAEPEEPIGIPYGSSSASIDRDRDAPATEQRLAELSKLRGSGTITEYEYAQKRAEILKEL